MATKEKASLQYDILRIGQMAKKHKQQDSTVVNGTVGVLYNDQSEIWKIEEVDKTIRSLSADEFYNYSPLDGGIEFKEAVKNWVFGESRNEIESKMAIEVIATPGGTGALSAAISQNLDEGEILLLPNFYWAPYKGMATGCKANVLEYEYFENGHYNLKAFQEATYQITKHQNKLITILNDPCNNPTGYSLTLQEFKDLIEFLNSLSVNVILIYDIAYFDYYIDGMKDVRERFKLLASLKEHVTILIAHSCSKSFSVYGLRVGSTIILNKKEEEVKKRYEATCLYGRTHWSSTSRPGVNMLVKINQNKELTKELQKELTTICQVVKERAEIFTKEANECGLATYKYGGGFFMTILTKHPYDDFAKLMEKGIYLIPLPKALRIAICGIPTKELYGLAYKIKQILDEK